MSAGSATEPAPSAIVKNYKRISSKTGVIWVTRAVKPMQQNRQTVFS
jgi:hypothetical protein